MKNSIMFKGSQVFPGFVTRCAGKALQRRVLTTTDRTVVLPFPLQTTTSQEPHNSLTQCYTSQELSKSINSQDTNTTSVPIINQENVISYEGTVTKYVSDSIIELDHEVQLVLIHYLCPDEGRALRIGAKIRVDNAHLIFLQSEFIVCFLFYQGAEIFSGIRMLCV
jgi:hypothetical protein